MVELLVLQKFKKPFGNLGEAVKFIKLMSDTTVDNYTITKQHHTKSKRG